MHGAVGEASYRRLPVRSGRALERAAGLHVPSQAAAVQLQEVPEGVDAHSFWVGSSVAGWCCTNCPQQAVHGKWCGYDVAGPHCCVCCYEQAEFVKLVGLA